MKEHAPRPVAPHPRDAFKRSAEQFERDVDMELTRMEMRGGDETTAERIAHAAREAAGPGAGIDDTTTIEPTRRMRRVLDSGAHRTDGTTFGKAVAERASDAPEPVPETRRSHRPERKSLEARLSGTTTQFNILVTAMTRTMERGGRIAQFGDELDFVERTLMALKDEAQASGAGRLEMEGLAKQLEKAHRLQRVIAEEQAADAPKSEPSPLPFSEGVEETLASPELEHLSSIEHYVLEKSGEEAEKAGEGLTYGDVRVARSTLRDEIKLLEKNPAGSKAALKRKLHLFKKLEVAEKTLRQEMEREHREQTRHIQHYGEHEETDRALGGAYIGERPAETHFNKISAAETFRNAKAEDWEAPEKEEEYVYQETPERRRANAGHEAAVRAAEKYDRERQEQLAKERRQQEEESAEAMRRVVRTSESDKDRGPSSLRKTVPSAAKKQPQSGWGRFKKALFGLFSDKDAA